MGEKTSDREQTRRDAEWLLHHWTEPAFVRPKFQEVAISIGRSIPALLAELEQAERDRDELLQDSVVAQDELRNVERERNEAIGEAAAWNGLRVKADARALAAEQREAALVEAGNAALKESVRLPPADCTEACMDGPCDCSGEWRYPPGTQALAAALAAHE